MQNEKNLSYSKVVTLGFLVYFFSYAMRLDYAASLVAIVPDLGISNTAASAAVTGSFITYGVAQIVFGFIGDKISPVKMISLAMMGTIIVNAAVSLCSNILVITILWCLNGIFQAMLWPPLCRFVYEQVGTKKYGDAVVTVGLSASVATIFIYLIVPLILEITVWRNVFRCMAVLGIVMMLAWIRGTKGTNMGKAVVTAKFGNEIKISVWGLISLAGLVPIFITIALQGILRDGIQTWLPSLVNEQFGLGKSSSVLSTAFLPVLSTVSVIVANRINAKLRNELKTSAVMFLIAFIATIPLGVGLKIPALVTVVSASVISACMHGVNLMLICVIPKNFAKYGMVSTFSGVLNAFTYVGASLSTYGFAVIADNLGWNVVLISWCVIAFAGSLLCLFKVKGWGKFIANS